MAVPDLRSNSYYMNKFTSANEGKVKQSYEEIAGSYIPQGLLNDQCFSSHQQRLYYHHQQQQQQQQPFPITMSLPPSLNHPLPFPGGGGYRGLLVQEPILPKFPPQMFDIPDIHDSNSVFNEGGHHFEMNGGGATVKQLNQAAVELPHHGSRTTLMTFPPTEWQPRFISTAGSTDSSPMTHSEENNSYDHSLPRPLTPQQNLRYNIFNSSSVSKPPVKKTKSTKKRKRKDPNEPQKPVSAYSLFFRNAQAAIKSQNPSATFGDISKTVASMWDNLDNEIKRFYKRQMEVAKKEYLKQLAAYRSTLSSQETDGPSIVNKSDADRSPQNALSPSSSLSSAAVVAQMNQRPTTDESSSSSSLTIQRQMASERPSHVVLPRPPSIEEMAVVKTSALSQGMQQQQQVQQRSSSPHAYFPELLTPGSSLPTAIIYRGQLPDVPDMRHIFPSYNQRLDYFNSVALPQNVVYAPRGYDVFPASSGDWNIPLRNVEYVPTMMRDSFINNRPREATVGPHGIVDPVKWT